MNEKIFDSNFTEVYSEVYYWQLARITLGNGLVGFLNPDTWREFGNATRVIWASSDSNNIAAEYQDPAEMLSQLGDTSNHPVYGEYKCC